MTPPSPMRRETRHRLIQTLFWNRAGFAALRSFRRFAHKVEAIGCNRSLHSATNGEYWLVSSLPERCTVVDVGFYRGEFSLSVLKARPSGRVLGVDPARTAARYHAEHLSGVPGLRFANVALSSSRGRATFHDYGNMNSSLAVRSDMHPGEAPMATYEVEVLTLGDLMDRERFERLDLLKVDAEGFDMNCMEGAESALREGRVDGVLFEYANGWICNRRYLSDAAAFYRGLGWRLYRLFNGFLSPLEYTTSDERFDLAAMIVASPDKGLASRVRIVQTGL